MEAVGSISRFHSRVPQRTESATASCEMLTPEARLSSAASGELVRPQPFQRLGKGLIEFWLYKVSLGATHSHIWSGDCEARCEGYPRIRTGAQMSGSTLVVRSWPCIAAYATPCVDGWASGRGAPPPARKTRTG